MFVNDLTGLCRSGVFGGDFTTQVPVGYHPWANVPYGLGYNVPGQVFNPAFNYLYNRIPQGLAHQGFIPQTFAPVSPIAHNPFLPFFGGTNVPFAGTIAPHMAGVTANQIGYGYNPYTAVPNWCIPQTFQGWGTQVPQNLHGFGSQFPQNYQGFGSQFPQNYQGFGSQVPQNLQGFAPQYNTTCR
jgi:hypothetical protein